MPSWLAGEVLGVVGGLKPARSRLFGEERRHAHVPEGGMMPKGLAVDRHRQQLRISTRRIHRQRQTFGKVIRAAQQVIERNGA